MFGAESQKKREPTLITEKMIKKKTYLWYEKDEEKNVVLFNSKAFLWHERFICKFLCGIIMNVKGFPPPPPCNSNLHLEYTHRVDINSAIIHDC
jgi:hypothetical protein